MGQRDKIQSGEIKDLYDRILLTKQSNAWQLQVSFPAARFRPNNRLIIKLKAETYTLNCQSVFKEQRLGPASMANKLFCIRSLFSFFSIFLYSYCTIPKLIISALLIAPSMAVIAVAPTGRASFAYSYVQTKLRGHYNGK